MNKKDQNELGNIYTNIINERFQVGAAQKQGGPNNPTFSNDRRGKMGSGFTSQGDIETGIRTMLARSIVKHANPELDHGYSLNDAVKAAAGELRGILDKSYEDLKAQSQARVGNAFHKIVATAMVKTIEALMNEGEDIGRAEAQAGNEIEGFAQKQLDAAVEQAHKLAAGLDFELK